MYFLGEEKGGRPLMAKPDERSMFERGRDNREAMADYFSAVDDLQKYRDNANAKSASLEEAYNRRIKAVQDATGVVLDHPQKMMTHMPSMDELAKIQPGESRYQAQQRIFSERLNELAQQYPDKADIIGADRAIEQDAYKITQGAVKREEAASKEIDQMRGAGWVKFWTGLGGGITGMLRDPVQLATLGLGAGSGTAATVTGRILQVAATEAAINGGVEMAVQLSAEKYRDEAGASIGWSGIWKQVGLAAAFGGGFGGLMQGTGEVLKALKKATPETEAALAKVSAGTATPEDMKTITDALDVQLEPEDFADLTRALEADAADAAARVAEPDVAAQVHAIETETAPTTPVFEQPAGNLAPENFGFFRPDELTVDAERFQFKEGGDAEGVTPALKGITEWRPERAGVLVVFEQKDGRRFVADGHQRSGLARRLEAETGQQISLPGYLFKEADGFTAEDVRVIAALKNIGEGSGSAIDAAKVLRSGKVTAEGAKLPPNSALVRDAAGLARLSDDAFAMAVNEVIDPRLAAIVGRLVDNEKIHAQVISVLKDLNARTAGETESIVKDLMAETTVTEFQDSLFGTEEITRMLLKEKASVRQAALTALKRDKQVFNRLVEEENRIASAGNVLDNAANAERAKSDAILIEAIDRLSRQAGPIAKALDAAATAVAGGEGARSASRGFVEAVRAEIERSGGNLGRVGEEGPGQLVTPELRESGVAEPATKQSVDRSEATLIAASDSLSAAGVDAAVRQETGGLLANLQDVSAKMEAIDQKIVDGKKLTKADRKLVEQWAAAENELNMAEAAVQKAALDERAQAAGLEISIDEAGSVHNDVYGVDLKNYDLVISKDGKQVATASRPDQAIAAIEKYGTATSPAARPAPASWVIRDKKTGEVVMETFDKNKVDALNTDRYEAVAIGDYLPELNAAIKAATGSEATAAGDQLLIDGINAITDAERMAADAARPMRGGDAAPPAGGLFDDGARDQIDLMDVIPAGTDADGNVRHVTHADMIADADQTDLLADLVASCKD